MAERLFNGKQIKFYRVGSERINYVYKEIRIRGFDIYWVAKGIGFGGAAFTQRNTDRFIFGDPAHPWTCDDECMHREFITALLEEYLKRRRERRRHRDKGKDIIRDAVDRLLHSQEFELTSDKDRVA